MALFGTKKQEKEKVKDTAKEAVSESPKVALHAVDDVLSRPHVTEKAYAMSKQNVYTFEVSANSNKHSIAKAFTKIYGVTPVRVNVVKKRPRVVRSLMRAQSSKQSGIKKAYVYLKEGDTISYI